MAPRCARRERGQRPKYKRRHDLGAFVFRPLVSFVRPAEGGRATGQSVIPSVRPPRLRASACMLSFFSIVLCASVVKLPSAIRPNLNKGCTRRRGDAEQQG